MIEMTVAKIVKENIEVALKLIDGHDLSSNVARERLEESLGLLDESILRESIETTDGTGPAAGVEVRINGRRQTVGFPLKIWFRRTKADQWIPGKLELTEPDGSLILRFNGQVFYSPSKAACTLAGNSRDGWRDIYYDDSESGRRLPIGALKERGLLSRQDFSKQT